MQNATSNEQAALLEQRGNYALVFISVVYGLVLSPYTSSWVRLAGLLRSKFLFSPPVLILVAFSIILLEVWWAMFDGLKKLGSSFFQFFLAIAEAMSFLAIGSFIDNIFSKSKLGDPYPAYYAHHVKLYSAIIILIFLLMLSNLLGSYFAQLLRTIGIILASLPLFFSSTYLHCLVAWAFLVLCVTFTVLRVNGRFRVPSTI